MSWETELVGILRQMLDDTISPYTYSDVRLQQVLVSSAQMVRADAKIFANTYTISFDTLTISPDPTDESTRDDAYVNLILLRSACLIAKAETRKAANQSFMVREFDTLVDTRDKGRNKLEIAKNWCKDYDDALLAYIAGESIPGKAILGPFRVYPKSAYGR